MRPPAGSRPSARCRGRPSAASCGGGWSPRLADRSQPIRVRRLIVAYAGLGFCLLAVAAVGLAGVGPLAA